jgi:hypothetical protein
MIIGVTGNKGAGKSLACEGLSGWAIMSFAWPLKQVCGVVFDLTDEEMNEPELKEKPIARWPFESPRKLLQRVGTDMFRQHYPEVWVQSLKSRIAQCQGKNIAITDVRFENEAKALREVGAHIIKVIRPSNKHAEDLHPSEIEMSAIGPDASVINDGSKDRLQTRLRLAVLELQEGK